MLPSNSLSSKEACISLSIAVNRQGFTQKRFITKRIVRSFDANYPGLRCAANH